MAEHKSDFNLVTLMVLAFIAFLAGLAFVTQDYIRKASVVEARNIEMELGSSTLNRINEIADDWYFSFKDKASVEMAEVDLLSDDPEQRRRELALIEGSQNKLNAWVEARKEALLDLGFWVLRRVALFMVYLPLWIPLIVLSVYHGLMDREIKKTDFGYTSPVLNHWARRVMSLVTLGTILLFLSPVAIDPLLFPLMMGFWSIAAGIAMGNIQKRI